jgi:two-component system LytT family response regulator
MEARLDPALFMRIHRSTIVNIRAVSEFRPFFNGSYLIMMKDQTRLYSSRGYHPKLDQFLSALQ